MTVTTNIFIPSFLPALKKQKKKILYYYRYSRPGRWWWYGGGAQYYTQWVTVTLLLHAGLANL